MKQNVTLVLLGVLIGAVLMLAVPSRAHHSDSYSRLNAKIRRLQGLTRGFNNWGELDPAYLQLPSNCTADDPAVWNLSGSGLGC